ncbi:MAG: HAD hydrolase-like protein [Bacteriovorax sp.]|nr:HAD hydrolase-like protein [Bacteriovorax sp.]
MKAVINTLFLDIGRVLGTNGWDYKQRNFAAEKFAIDAVEMNERYHIKVAVVSNERRELTEHRIKKFRLGSFIDFFIASAFVHFRKPDIDIFQFSLDIAQVAPEQVAYIEDRAMLVEVAATLGIKSIQHKNLQETEAAIADLGVRLL